MADESHAWTDAEGFVWYMPTEQPAGRELARLAARERERQAARLWAGQNRALLVEIATTIPGTKALAIGTGEPGPRIVPCRNLILISLAAGVAQEHGAAEVWYGATAEDFAYPDCQPEFAKALSRVLSLESGVSVHAPLVGMRRADIRILARSLAVRVDDTWSCYQPTPEGKPCGECNSCRQDAEFAPAEARLVEVDGR